MMGRIDGKVIRDMSSLRPIDGMMKMYMYTDRDSERERERQTDNERERQ